MMRRLITIFLINILFYQTLSASFSLVNLEHLNNQLSNNAILCMHQDPYGFMWFGTYDGLNLYDGKEVTIFRFEADNPSSLSGNTIHNIVDAGKGHLWISTQLGLNRFSLKERKVVEYFPDYRRVDLIATDSKENTWMISKENYISYYNSQLRMLYEIPSEIAIPDEVRAFFIDSEDRLCIVKKNGSLLYVRLDPKVLLNGVPYSLIVDERNFHNRMINQVFYEEKQIYLIDEDQNLFVYNDSKQQKILLRNISEIVNKYGIIASLSFFQSDIYIAFMHSGLVKINASSHGKKPELINMTIGIFGMLKDRHQDAMWVGTDGHGVSLYYSEKDQFGNILLDHLPFTAKRPIRAFYTDEENTLWVGTKGDGIIRIKDYDRFKNRSIPASNIQHFITHGGLYENPIYFFSRSKYNKNDLWIGTDGNVSYYSYQTNRIYVVEDSPELGNLITNVHSFCEVNDSTLWVSSRGLYEVVIDKTKHPYRIKSKKHHVFLKDNVTINDEFYSMIFDGDSTLVMGSRGGYGVIKFNIYNGRHRFISMDKAENRALGDVICIYLDKDSVLYIGASSGLTQIKIVDGKETAIKQFNRNDGIINDMIHGILEDNVGIIWLSTNKGLVKYNPVNDSFFNVKSSQIGVSEYSDDAYWHCPITGRLFFGGVNGFIWIEPKDGKELPAHEPDLLFTTVNHFGTEQTLYEFNDDRTKKLKLPAKKNTFQISFAVLDYINGDNYDYAYLLENYNSRWVSLQKENKISFTNLPPGNYTLKVKYKNDVVQADDKIYVLPITILPPWYFSTWAYFVYGILAILLITYSVYYTRRNFRRKQLRVAKRIKEEQREKLYESKLRFFY